MKKLLTLITAFICTVSVHAQEKPLSPRTTAKSDNIEITYGQPSKRDRKVFGELVPYNEVWRTGANEATVITLKKDALIGGKKVPAGTYTLFTIPGQKEWKVILNSAKGQWGAYEYDKIKDKNVAESKADVYKLDNTREQFTILVKKDAIQFEWDMTGASMPVSFQ